MSNLISLLRFRLNFVFRFNDIVNKATVLHEYFNMFFIAIVPEIIIKSRRNSLCICTQNKCHFDIGFFYDYIVYFLFFVIINNSLWFTPIHR